MENKITEAFLPSKDDPRIKEAMVALNCNRAMCLEIRLKPLTKENDCHNNVLRYVSTYGGQQIKGYYLAVDRHSEVWAAFGHSVWKRDSELIDITPVSDERTHNIFIWNDKQETEVESYIIGGIKQDMNDDLLTGFKL